MDKQKMAIDYSTFTINDWKQEVLNKNFKSPDSLEKFEDYAEKNMALLKAFFTFNTKKRNEKMTDILIADKEEDRIAEFVKMLFYGGNGIKNEVRQEVLRMIPLNESIKQMVMKTYDRSPADMLFVAMRIEEVMRESV